MSYFNKKGKYDDKPVSLKSIREHRFANKEMSQLELSQATSLRIPQGLISELERGTRRLTSWTAPLIADVFEVGVEDLILGNNLALLGVKHSDRLGILKTAVKNKNRELVKAVKSIIKLEDLDFGNRNSLGVKLDKEEVEARKDAGDMTIERDSFGRKRTKKEIKERRKEAEKKRAEKRVEKSKDKALDFGDRDSFGRKLDETQIAEKKRVAVKMSSDLEDEDFLASLKGLTESEKFMAKLNRLLEKGEEQRQG